ncbi:hypothetical protein TrLO_g11973 [Triparma laevis f. longispina]|uniref:Uncharacterized protein n=1 Tax=Triparma laevis f. longispina TaxID=1714387 RepID=A0A9W7F877_9STRA|nr:hypothetical protein TrLO_g11973 [Triparma laevis f. longispina]
MAPTSLSAIQSPSKPIEQHIFESRIAPALSNATVPYLKAILSGQHPSSIKRKDNSMLKGETSAALARKPRLAPEELAKAEKRRLRKIEREKLKHLADKIASKTRHMRKTAQRMATYGKKGGNTMANAAADVKAMLEGAPGAALHHSGKNHRGQGVFRVRRSILTTSKKEKEKHQNEFMKIFEEQTRAKEKEKKGKKNVNFGESKKKKQEPVKAKRKIRKSLKGDMPVAPKKNEKVKRDKARVTNLLECLSSQSNAPLHYGMEVAIEAMTGDGEEPMFLTCLHPNGATKVLPASSIRAGAGEFRGGVPPSIEFGPTDVCVFKIVDLRNLKSNKVIKFGEPFWLVVCIGRNKGRGHWTDGSVLSAKADKGIYVPVVPLDPKSGAMGGNGGEEFDGGHHDVLGVPGPVSATLDFESSSIEVFNQGNDMSSVTYANKIALENGKFHFKTADSALAARIEEASLRGEYTELCNMNEGLLEQDFFAISRTSMSDEGTCLRQCSFEEKGGGDNFHHDIRSIFRIRQMDVKASTKYVTMSEKRAMKAKDVLKQSSRRRHGEKVMYEIKDRFEQQDIARFQADDGAVFVGKGAGVSPIRGGKNFMADVRIRTMASVDTAVEDTFKKAAESDDLKARYKKLLQKVDKEVSVGMIDDGMAGPPVGLEPTAIRNIREMKAALPKLHPSTYKLKSKRLEELERSMAAEEADESDDDEMTRQEYYAELMEDENIPLSEVKAALCDSQAMPTYNKLIQNDKEVKQMLKKPPTATVAASIQASASVENFIPMSRQGGPRHSPVGVPEVDVMSNPPTPATGSMRTRTPGSRGTAGSGNRSKSGSRNGSRTRTPVATNVAPLGGPHQHRHSTVRDLKGFRLSAEKQKEFADARRKSQFFFGEIWEGEGMEEYHEEWKEKYNQKEQMDRLKVEDAKIKKTIKYDAEILHKSAINEIVKNIANEIKLHNEQVKADSMMLGAFKKQTLHEEAEALREAKEAKEAEANEANEEKEVKEAKEAKEAEGKKKKKGPQKQRVTLRLFEATHTKMVEKNSAAVLIGYVKKWLDRTRLKRNDKRQLELALEEKRSWRAESSNRPKKTWDEIEKDEDFDGGGQGELGEEEEEEEVAAKNSDAIEVADEEDEDEEDGVAPLNHNFASPKTKEKRTTALQVLIGDKERPVPPYIDGEVVSDQGAIVRLCPHLDSKAICILPPGTKLRVYERGIDDLNPQKTRLFVSGEFTSVVEEETEKEKERRLREESGVEYDEDEEESEEEESDEEEGELVVKRTVDIETANLVKSQIKGWVSLKEAGDEFDRDIVKLVPSDLSDKPYLDLRRIRCTKSGSIPKVLKCKIIGAAGAILREGPQLDSKFIKRIPAGTYVLVKNVECVSDSDSIMNQRVYIEQMPCVTQHGFEYLYPYNLEVAQPRVIGTPYDGAPGERRARISKPVKCSEHICELLGWDAGELHSKVECREGVEKYVRKHTLVTVDEEGRKVFDLEESEEGRKLGELFDNGGKEVTFTNFQPYVDAHAGGERIKTASSAGLGGGEEEEEGSPVQFKVKLVKGDNFLYTGWTSVSSVFEYPILEPESEHLEDYFSPEIKKKKEDERRKRTEEVEGEKKNLLSKLESLKVELREEKREKEKGGEKERVVFEDSGFEDEEEDEGEGLDVFE